MNNVLNFHLHIYICTDTARKPKPLRGSQRVTQWVDAVSVISCVKEKCCLFDVFVGLSQCASVEVKKHRLQPENDIQ